MSTREMLVAAALEGLAVNIEDFESAAKAGRLAVVAAEQALAGVSKYAETRQLWLPVDKPPEKSMSVLVALRAEDKVVVRESRYHSGTGKFVNMFGGVWYTEIVAWTYIPEYRV